MRNFKEGQKIVCVDDSPRKHTPKVLEKDKVYTFKAYSPTKIGTTGILIEEVSIYPYCFRENRFEPAKEIDDFAENLCAKLIEEFKEEQKKEYINN